MGSVLVKSTPSPLISGTAPIVFESIGVLENSGVPEGILDGIVGSWDLNESGDAPAYDWGPYGLHGANWNFATSGDGARLTNKEDESHFVILDSPEFATGLVPFCGTIWVKLLSKGSYQGIFTKSAGSLSNLGFGLNYVNTSDRYEFSATYHHYDTIGVKAVANSFGSPPVDEWHMLYFQYNPSDGPHGTLGIAVDNGPLETINFYLAGFPAGPAAYGGIQQKDYPIRLGHRSPFEWPQNYYLDGYLKLARFWLGRILDSTDREFLYNAGSGKTWNQLGGSNITPTPSIPIITNVVDGYDLWILGDGTNVDLGYIFASGYPRPSFSIAGGVDGDKFQIDSVTGALSFIDPPDFAVPEDDDLNNRYEFQLAATNSEGSQVFDLTAIVGNGEPELPREYVDTDLPEDYDNAPNDSPLNATALRTTSMTSINQNGGGSYIIELQAGQTYTMSVLPIPNKTGEEWVLIRSSNYELLPEGERVTPDDAVNMAKLSFNEINIGGIAFAEGAHKIRFIGIEIQTTVQNQTGLIQLNRHNSDVILDRCYIHGGSTLETRRGVVMHGRRIAIIDSWIDEFHETQNGDTQAIACWDGRGPYKLVNNHLSSAGEVFITGGSVCSGYHEIPSDWEIRRNHFYKPASWNPYHADYAGITWQAKNIFEIKNAKRVLIENNVFSGNWASAQSGLSMVFTVRNTGGHEWWASCEDILFQYNRVDRTGRGINITSRDADPGKSHTTKRMLFAHNLIIMDNAFKGWNNLGDWFSWLGGYRAEFIVARHNTCVSQDGIKPLKFADLDAAGWAPPGKFADEFIFVDNICPMGVYSIHSPIGTSMLERFNLYFEDYEITKNLRIQQGTDPSTWPTGNMFVQEMNDVGFVDWENGNYQLDASSPYITAATDGSMIGANIAELNIRLTGVIS